MRKNLALVGTAAAIAALSFSGVARADILPSAQAPTVTATGNGTFIWTYEIFVTQAQEVRTGNSFTMYDFAGFQGVTSAPSGFSSSVALTGNPVTTDFGVILPNDDAALPNITFTYTGPNTIVGGPLSLGLFSLESTVGGIGPRQTFVGMGTDRDSGLVNANITNYIAPVPEPGEYAVAGVFAAGLFGLVLRARRRSSVSGLAA